MIKNHATGDVLAVYWPHLKKIITVFLRYLVFILIPWLFPFYLFWPIIKFYRGVNHPLALIYLPILQIIADLGIIIGAIRGGIIKGYDSSI